MPPTNSLWHAQQRASKESNENTKKQYICPAETTPHRATILGFPSRCSTLPGLYKRTCNEIVDLAGTIAVFEPVRLHVRPEDQARAQTLVNQRLQASSDADKNRQQGRISLVPCATNHCWVRDTGPVYVRGADDQQRYAVDFGFCEWGNKTDEWIYGGSAETKTKTASKTESETPDDWPEMDESSRRENAVFASRALELENAADPTNPVTRVQAAIRLEGGGLEFDGEGTFMATESSIVEAGRNGGLSRANCEAELRRLLGIEKFIWFPGRLGLDITDCHVDAEARFVRPGVVVLNRPRGSASSESADPVYWEMYNEMRSILESSTDARGRRFEIHDVEEPDLALVKGTLAHEEEAPAASYVNFYFVNGGLVIPAFGDPVADRNALEVLQKLLPDREIRQVAVNALPRTGGVLHCVTQQVL
ncbi:hypothetical protein NUU61_009969 [Penicillium alfredii]|uniref:Uncharacterized protein n=1 Tax=Penicillium alfredii TaxID=1506179 RepID=A0A9W9JU71_9EURO|nr:uncharacterized protein NUU61_009969 [Penicillium alfredii]KAJ5081705.1 hypothetical protein NUU61_009969 [Penicillium alfredii]